MVALLGDHKIADAEIPKKESFPKEETFQEESIRNGHENWFLGLINNGVQFAFKRDSMHHHGLIDFDTMSWLVELFKDRDPDQPFFRTQKELDDFRNELIVQIGFHSGEFSTRRAVDNDLGEKLGDYRKEIITNTIPNSTQDQIEAWIRTIVFGKKPFYKNNDNWAKTAEEINNKLVVAPEPLVQLQKYRDEYEEFNSIPTFDGLKKFLYHNPDGKELFILLEDIHGGWRNEVYPRLQQVDSRENFTNDRYKKLTSAVRSLEGLIRGTIATSNLSESDLKEVIIAQIDTERSNAQSDPNLDSYYTFDLIVELGVMLEKILSETSQVITKNVIGAVRNNLLYDLKKDADIAPIQALENYYGKNKRRTDAI